MTTYRWAVVDDTTGDIGIYRTEKHAREALARRHNLGMHGFRLTRFKLVECSEGKDND